MLEDQERNNYDKSLNFPSDLSEQERWFTERRSVFNKTSFNFCLRNNIFKYVSMAWMSFSKLIIIRKKKIKFKLEFYIDLKEYLFFVK